MYVDGDSAAVVDGIVEGVKVGADLGLRDHHVFFHYVVVYVADGDPIEDLVGVLECGEHPIFERDGTDVDGNVAGVEILRPVDVQYVVFCKEMFALGSICTGKYVRIHLGCIGGGRGVEVPITNVENGRCLEHAQVALSSSPVLGSFDRN